MPIRRRTASALLAAAGGAAALAASAPFAAVGGPAGLPLPDLRSDPPENQLAPQVHTDGSLIVRFDGHVTNVGPGPLHLEGNPQAAPGSGDEPRQYVFDPADYRDVGSGPPIDPATLAPDPDDREGWQAVTTPEVLYEDLDTHFHFHYMRISRYSLWNEAQTAEVAPARKVGFCLYDSSPAPGLPSTPEPLSFGVFSGGYVSGYNGGGDFCRQYRPEATTLQMGVSPGWRDTYTSGLTLQWVDVSDTAPGRYYLAAEADPENRVVEVDENNGIAFASEITTIPGYNALPVSASTRSPTPVGLTLGAERFGAPGRRTFRVVRPPTNGTLDVTAGVALSGPRVTYRPNPGFSGVDSFEYVARDSTSAYPRNPRTAAATIQVGAGPTGGSAPPSGPAGPPLGPGSAGPAPRVVVAAISGAPASLIVGTSAQLSASVANGSGGVAWSVNGVPGGNPTVGTITAGGLYVAPASVPSGGAVTVRATSVDDPSAFAEKSIAIRRALRVKPKPGAKTKTSEPRVVVTRGRAVISTQAKVAGRFAVVARYLRPGKGARVLARCSAHRKAGRTHRCTVRFAKRLIRKHVQVIVVFTPKSGTRVVRRIGPTRLGKLRFVVARRGALKGRRVTVSARSPRTGRVILVLRHRNRIVRRCLVNRLAGQVASCQVTLRRGQKATHLRATVTLRAEDGLRSTRRGRPGR